MSNEVAKVFIPPGAQYFIGSVRAFYRVEKNVVQTWRDAAWQDANWDLREFNGQLALKGYIMPVAEVTTLQPTTFSVSETGWYAQFADKADDFGRINDRGEHPVRGTIFQAYRFPDEAACRNYCKGKELLLVPCRVTIKAELAHH